MNKREAVAVQALLDWILNLKVFEHDQDVSTDVLSDDEFVRIVGVLADRSHEALGAAGLRQGEAIDAAMRLLGMGRIETFHLPDHDVPPNAGSAT